MTNDALNDALILTWSKLKDVNDELISSISDVQTDISGETSARQTAISGLQSTISGLETALLAKEDVSNKINEIVEDETLKKYVSANAINNWKIQVDNTLQNISNSIPEIEQGTGTSTTKVMSQKAVTDAISSAAGVSGNLKPKGDVDTLGELPNDANDGDLYYVKDEQVWYFYLNDAWYNMSNSVDLSEYSTTQQMHSAIEDITGELENLETTDTTSLVGAINENKIRIDNNTTSISGIATDLATESSTRSSAITGLNNKITTIEESLTNLNSIIDLTAFEEYVTENPIEV